MSWPGHGQRGRQAEGASDHVRAFAGKDQLCKKSQGQAVAPRMLCGLGQVPSHL